MSATFTSQVALAHLENIARFIERNPLATSKEVVAFSRLDASSAYAYLRQLERTFKIHQVSRTPFRTTWALGAGDTPPRQVVRRPKVKMLRAPARGADDYPYQPTVRAWPQMPVVDPCALPRAFFRSAGAAA